MCVCMYFVYMYMYKYIYEYKYMNACVYVFICIFFLKIIQSYYRNENNRQAKEKVKITHGPYTAKILMYFLLVFKYSKSPFLLNIIS